MLKRECANRSGSGRRDRIPRLVYHQPGVAVDPIFDNSTVLDAQDLGASEVGPRRVVISGALPAKCDQIAVHQRPDLDCEAQAQHRLAHLHAPAGERIAPDHWEEAKNLPLELEHGITGLSVMTYVQIKTANLRFRRYGTVGTTAMVALILGACSQPDDNGRGNASGVEQSTITAGRSPPIPAPTRSQPETFGGDGSMIQLTALSTTDIRNARLEGELSCGFAKEEGDTLLHAAGDAGSSERALGLVKVAHSVENVSAAGGFDGMVRGGSFTGKGKTVLIRITGNRSEKGHESPLHEATLTFERADGASRTISGTWTCGP